MQWRKRLKQLSKICLTFVVVLVVFELWMIQAQSRKIFSVDAVTDDWQVAIVPGASVLRSGQPSDILADRLLTALDLYTEGKVDLFLLSGDHGQDGYDEVGVMGKYLLSHDVPKEKIFLDHAGFDTYDTLYRAKTIFQAESAIIVTQRFHLPRALYIAEALDLPAIGVEADRQLYVKAALFSLREWPARLKAFLNVVTKAKPSYLGDLIPLNGDSKNTWDDNGE